MPHSSTAYFCGYYCKRNNIPFVIDIIDLWPDSLIPLFKFNSILKLILIPWRLLTKKAYSFANYISAESKEYALDAHRINPKVPWSYTYLGVNINQVEELISQSKLNLVKPVDEIWICYGGHSYDFNCILKAIKFINQKGIKYKMLFIGDGEKRKHIEKFALKNKLQIQITGRVSYNDFLKYLSECDIGINSFKKGTRIVHSYKFNDYVSAKLFIINNLKGETSEMINKYKVGLNFSGDNLSEILYGVCLNWVRFSEYRSNINFLVKNELDSTVIYQKLASDILNL
jgi:hypothetical protein